MKTKKTLALITICLLILFLSNKGYSQDNYHIKEKQNRVSSFGGSTNDTLFPTINQLLDDFKTPGVSIVIIDSFKIVYSKGFGRTNSKDNIHVNSNSIFQSASIGKSITAVAVMHYVQNELLNLDEDVNNKLTSWKVPESIYTKHEKITLRRLLSHTAGINVHGFTGYKPHEKTPTLLQLLNGEFPANNDPITIKRIPGSEFRYSGGGYMIIQQLLEDEFKKPFNEIVDEIVFQPLKMNSSFYSVTIPQKDTCNIAFPHDRTGQVSSYGRCHNFIEFGAGGGLWTTAEDLAKFVIELMKSHQGNSNIILSKEIVRGMFAPQKNSDSYGLGFFTKKNGLEVFHTGSNDPGYEHVMYMFPAIGKGAIIMTNGYRGSELYQKLIAKIAKEFSWP